MHSLARNYTKKERCGVGLKKMDIRVNIPLGLTPTGGGGLMLSNASAITCILVPTHRVFGNEGYQRKANDLGGGRDGGGGVGGDDGGGGDGGGGDGGGPHGGGGEGGGVGGRGDGGGGGDGGGEEGGGGKGGGKRR